MCNKLITLTLIFCVTFLLSDCSEFLQEKPEFLHTCQRDMPDLSKCMAMAFQNIFSSWKNGISGVDDPKSIDPLFVNKFDVIEDQGNATPITVKISNITVTGLSQAEVRNVSFKNAKAFDFKMTYFVPKIRLEGNYSAIGQVLLLKLDTKGEMFMEIVDGLYTVVTKIKLRTHKNFKFFDLKSLQITINSIENVRFEFSNLFKDKALNDNTNAVFNESWRLFFDMFKPKIEQEINGVLLAHFRHVFENVPAQFFLADVEKDN